MQMGLPPDSDASEKHFTCGTEGVKAVAEGRQQIYQGSVDYIGTWHTHPRSAPEPSSTDRAAVKSVLGDIDPFLLLILSGELDNLEIGVHVYEKSDDHSFQPRFYRNYR